MKTKMIDIANILLILFIAAIIAYRFYPKQFLSNRQSSITGTGASPESSWGRNREFPDDFTDEEKLILTEQKHDYERVTDEDQRIYEKYLELLRTERDRGGKISVFRYGEDCFAKPVVVEMDYGSKLTLVNTGKEPLNIGIGKGNWDLAPEQQIAVTPEFDNIKIGENLQGYSCSPYGLAGYLILKK